MTRPGTLTLSLACIALATLCATPAHATVTVSHKTVKETHAKTKPVKVKPSAKSAPSPATADEERSTGLNTPPEETTSATLVDAPEQLPQGVVLGSRPFPWYGSLKKTEVNVRSGPGNQYPILWIYQRAGYPVQVLTRYDNYYKLRDVEGEEGWAYIGMVSKRTTALVGGDKPADLHRKNKPESSIIAHLAPDLIVELEECDASTAMCKVNAMGTKGWVTKSALQMVE